MRGRSILIALLVIVTGAALGGAVSQLAEGVSWLQWLSLGTHIGLTQPLTLDLALLTLTLGFTVQVNLGMIVGMILSLLLYRWLVRK